MHKRTVVFGVLLSVLLAIVTAAQTTSITAIKAGRLVDPETGTASVNQIILSKPKRLSSEKKGGIYDCREQ